MHLLSLDISLLLKGRTRTATFTDDMLNIFSDSSVMLFKNGLFVQPYIREKKMYKEISGVHNKRFLFNCDAFECINNKLPDVI